MTLVYSFATTNPLLAGRRAWGAEDLLRLLPQGAVYSARAGLFRDMAATQPANNPGDAVARIRDLSSKGFGAAQVQNSMRPVVGIHPARGAVNFLPADTTDLVAGQGWATVRANRAASSTSAMGEPAVHLSASEANVNGAFLQGGGVIPLAAGNYTLSFVVKGTGWCAIRPVVTNAPLDLACAWFNLATGQLGNTSLGLQGGAFVDLDHAITPVGDGYRISCSFTLSTATTIFARIFIVDGNGSLPVSQGAAIRIEAPQLEPGTTASGYQRRPSALDITEQGQPDIPYLSVDGVDDFMTLDQPFAPMGAFTIAGALDWSDAIIAGNASGTTFLRLAAAPVLRAMGPEHHASLPNDPAWPQAGTSGPRVDVIRVSAAGSITFWRNGVPSALAPTLVGNVAPLPGLEFLFRSGTEHARARFYGAAIVPDAVSDADVMRLSRSLALQAGGVL